MQPHISTSQFVSIPGTFLGSSSLIFRVSKIITSEKSLIIYDVMKSHYYHCVKSNLGREVFSRNVLFKSVRSKFNINYKNSLNSNGVLIYLFDSLFRCPNSKNTKNLETWEKIRIS